MMCGAGMGDSDHHTPVNIPTILAGGGRGEPRRRVYPDNTPMTNLGLTILDKVGLNKDSIADSTGRLVDLMKFTIVNCKFTTAAAAALAFVLCASAEAAGPATLVDAAKPATWRRCGPSFRKRST